MTKAVTLRPPGSRRDVPAQVQVKWQQIAAWPQSTLRELRFHQQQAELLAEAARHLRDGQALEPLLDDPELRSAGDDLRSGVEHATQGATSHCHEVDQDLWRCLTASTGLQAGERVDFAASRTQLAGAGAAVAMCLDAVELVTEARGGLVLCVSGTRLLKSGLPGKRRAKAVLRPGRGFRRL